MWRLFQQTEIKKTVWAVSSEVCSASDDLWTVWAKCEALIIIIIKQSHWNQTLYSLTLFHITHMAQPARSSNFRLTWQMLSEICHVSMHLYAFYNKESNKEGFVHKMVYLIGLKPKTYQKWGFCNFCNKLQCPKNDKISWQIDVCVCVCLFLHECMGRYINTM